MIKIILSHAVYKDNILINVLNGDIIRKLEELSEGDSENRQTFWPFFLIRRIFMFSHSVDEKQIVINFVYLSIFYIFATNFTTKRWY